MTRKLKMVGFAVVGVFAMNLFAASGASALLPDTDAIVSELAPYKLTATQEGPSKFTLAGQALECTSANINATVNSATVIEILTEVPSYTGCTYAGQPATVIMNGCKYRLTGTTALTEDAIAHVVCEGLLFPIRLTLNAIACEVFVGSQTAEEGYTMTTTGLGIFSELTLHVTAKVKVTSKGDAAEGITCASLTNGTGTLEGTYSVRGERTTSPFERVGYTDETLGTE